MAKAKDRKPKTESGQKRNKRALVDEFAFPSDQERLPLPIASAYQVAMGTKEEIVGWLRGIPSDSRVILITFSNEASYRKYGPIYWQVAKMLQEIVARIERRRFEKLVDELMQSTEAPTGANSAKASRARATRVKRAAPRRRREE